MGEEETLDVLWGLGPRGWSSIAGRLVSHLLFKLVWVKLNPIGSADVSEEGCSWGGCWGR